MKNYLSKEFFDSVKQLLMKMKATLLILLLFASSLFATNVSSQVAKVNIALKDARVVEVLKSIEEQTNFLFVYNKEEIDLDRKVNINVSGQTIDEVLLNIFPNADVTYKKLGTSIILMKNDTYQQRTTSVSGKISDSTGAPLPGVTVLVKGTTNGTITDGDGNYSLSNIPSDATIVFSFVGMKTQEIAATGKSMIDVTLAEDAIGLEEVVAIGYGTRKKETLTGSVAKVDGETLKINPAPNISGSLGGKVPGLVSVNYSGQPGEDGNKLLIRGLGTLGNNSPLIIIDGVEAESIDRIDPNDIESISVLKDASAAIYGSKAANGVIIVTTKDGEIGKPRIEYGYNLGMGQPTMRPKLANAFEYNKYLNAYYVANNEADKQMSESNLEKLRNGSDPDNYYANTDWWDAVVRDFAPIQRHTASIRGGSEEIKYFVSVGKLDQESVFKNGADGFGQTNYRANIDWTVTRAIKIGAKLSGRFEDKTSQNVPMRDIWWFAQATNPRYPVSFSNGLIWEGKEDGYNPVMMVSDAGGLTTRKNKQFSNIFTYEINIPWVKGLTVDGWYSFDNGYGNLRCQQYPWTVFGRDANNNYYPVISKRLGQKTLTESTDWYTSETFNTKISYNTTIGKHKIAAFLAYEQNEYQSKWISAYRDGLITTNIDAQLFMGSSNGQVADGSSYKNARQNLFSRVSYNYDDRYLLDFTFRRDGSPIFPKDKRFGNFPGISAAWRISEEKFMKENPLSLSNLKLRASWGQLGNDRVAEYQYLTAYNYADGQVVMGGDHSVLAAFYPGVNANPDITWEVAENANIGIDASFLDNLIEVQFDLFRNSRKNILIPRNASIPDYIGLQLPNENLGKMKNEGYEIEISHSKKIGNFSYSISGNYSYNNNEVVDIDETPNALDWQKRTGKPFGAELFYKTDGLYTQADIDNPNLPKYGGAQAGDIKVIDYNDDGSINGDDRVRMEKSTDVPRVMYGFSLNAGYKAIDVNMIFQGAGNIYRYLYTADIGIRGNFLRDYYTDYWTPENLDARWPRANPNTFGSTQNNDFFLLPSGYLRLSTMEIGYTVPKVLSQRLSLNSLRFYFSGSNLITIYNELKYFDPELAESRGYYYPKQRIINFGVNVTF